jgi:hypothetical protein
MDAFRHAAEMRYAQLNAIKTNVHNINVCKVKNLPENMEEIRFVDKHLDTGLCVMLHSTQGNVLEVRGYDENGEEFSYKFHYQKGPSQPIAMRAVGMSGQVNKLKVSLEESPKDKHMTIHDMRQSK